MRALSTNKIMFFIDLTDVVTDGTFIWSDGTSLGYTNWNPNQPSDTTGSPDCGTVFTGKYCVSFKIL